MFKDYVISVLVLAVMIALLCGVVYTVITEWEYILFGILFLIGCFYALCFSCFWPNDKDLSILQKVVYTFLRSTLELHKEIKDLFTSDSNKGDKMDAAGEGVVECGEPTEDNRQNGAHSPFFTFYRVGPDMLTYHYPVDVDVYREITEEGGLIGPEKYKAFPGAIDAMRKDDNMWFLDSEQDEVRGLLEKDLLTLARKYGKVGAYSLLGSIADDLKTRTRYLEKGVELDCPKCKVSLAMSLYTSGRTQDGFSMLKRGADAGEKLGCFMVAISYQYGTLSEMNIQKACEYYIKAIGGEMDFYIYLNLGCILIESGFYHTALRYFDKMVKASIQNTDELKEYGNFDECISDYRTCEELLAMPFEERAKRVKVQAHSRRLTAIFCANHHAPEPCVPEHIPYSVGTFEPSAELFDIDSKDYEDRKVVQNLPAKREADKAEDFLFLTIPVRISNSKIYGTQREVLFLEKCCHAELNNYIQANLIPLRSMFKSMGYIFTYLPSHMNDLTDSSDRIGSFYNDYGRQMWQESWAFEHANPDFKAQEYWESMIPSEKLPDDCAGFLLYCPKIDDHDDHTNFDYILFPYRPGTDWPRAFREFFGILRKRTIVPIHNTEVTAPLLPSGSTLHVSAKYELTLRDSCDQVLAEIKMPTLSKVVYLALLNHIEGITIKNMVDYKDELWRYYEAIAGGKAKMENIDALCDPTNNSINEKISRIKSAFATAMKDKYVEEMPVFIPSGKRGEAIVVSVDRDRIIYEQKDERNGVV